MQLVRPSWSPVLQQVLMESVIAMASGSWLRQRCRSGMVVQVEKEFLSADDRQIMLGDGLVGDVESMDADADYAVRFPNLRGFASRRRWVFSKDSSKLCKW